MTYHCSADPTDVVAEDDQPCGNRPESATGLWELYASAATVSRLA